MPHAARVEQLQQMKSTTVDVPHLRHVDAVAQVKTNVPCCNHNPTFKYVFNAFASARRTMYAHNAAEADRMLTAERAELEANHSRSPPVDNSLEARGVGVSLLIPDETAKNPIAHRLVDSFATVSNSKTSSGLPITLRCRFTVFASVATGPLMFAIARESLASGPLPRSVPVMVLRWIVADGNDGSKGRIRTEFAAIANDASVSCVQKLLIDLSMKHRVDLPPEMYLPRGDACMRAEQQIADCDAEFLRIVDRTEEFALTTCMQASDVNSLFVVPDVFLRIVRKGAPKEILSCPDIIQGMLLCASACEVADVVTFVNSCITHNCGKLRPPPESDQRRFLLHVVATQVDAVCLNGMVSLYSAGGKPGNPISPPGTVVHSTRTMITQLADNLGQFDLYVQSLESVLPAEDALTPYMEKHLMRNIDYCRRSFNSRSAVPLEMSLTEESATSSTEDATDAVAVDGDERYIFASLGVQLTCPRTMLGDAIVILKRNGAAASIVDLLVKVASVRGCACTMKDAFDTCLRALQREEQILLEANTERDTLRRITDAALAITSLKRKRSLEEAGAAVVARPAKVRQLMAHLNAAKSTVCKVDLSVTTVDSSKQLVSVIVDALRTNEKKKPRAPSPGLIRDVQALVECSADVVSAVAHAFSMLDAVAVKEATGETAERRRRFLLQHAGGDAVHVFEVDETGGCACCGIGRIFEADDPVVVSIKLSSESTAIVTALVPKTKGKAKGKA